MEIVQTWIALSIIVLAVLLIAVVFGHRLFCKWQNKRAVKGAEQITAEAAVLT